MRVLKLLPLLALLAAPAAGQTVFPSNLALDGAPADSDNLIVCKVGDTRCKRTTRGTLRSGLLGTTGSQSQGFFFAGPCSGGAGTPLWRLICVGDLPALQLGAAPFGSEGTATKVLHGNASGLFTWSQIVGGDIASATIPDAALGTSYSGIGTCAANTYGVQWGRNAGPVCSATPWSRTGTVTSLTNLGDTVGVGTASPDVALAIDANATAPVGSTLTGTTSFHVTGPNTANLRVLLDGIAGVPSLDFRRTDNTLASPAAVASGDVIGQVTFSGYNGSAYVTASRAAIQSIASQTWTTSANGTELDFNVTNNGAVAVTNVFRIDNNGHMGAPGAVAAPTVACTGTGTSPPAPTVDTSSTDWSFRITVNTGTGPASTGTCTVTFGKAFNTYAFPVCILADGASAWGNESVIRLSTASLSAPVFSWSNEVTGVLTALTASSSYKFICHVDGI